MGDRYGHRACIVVYGAIYSLSCATMHSGDFWLLMFGRVCGGVAYSLLYSSCAPTPPPLCVGMPPAAASNSTLSRTIASLHSPFSPTNVLVSEL